MTELKAAREVRLEKKSKVKEKHYEKKVNRDAI